MFKKWAKAVTSRNKDWMHKSDEKSSREYEAERLLDDEREKLCESIAQRKSQPRGKLPTLSMPVET